ncbi:MAG: hypothetical protein IJ493_07755 [Clostridia bacterium]|nr:hypothetical protein [Clostridia bacterium]
MEQVIDRVLTLERQSKEKVAAAADRRERLPEELAERLKTMHADYMKHADQRISDIRAEENQRLKQETDTVTAYYARQTELLSKAAEKNLESWTEQIFRNVLDG